MLPEYVELPRVNKISAEMQKYLDDNIPKDGKLVKFRILQRERNIDPQREKGDDWLYPSCIIIPLSSKVKGKEGVHDLKLITSFDGVNAVPRVKSYIIVPQKGDGGYFFISPNNVADFEMLPFLLLSNYNKSNPFRDQAVIPVIELVDEAKEGRVRSKKRNFLYDSLDAIRHWTPQEMRISAAGNNIPGALELDIDIIKDRLEVLAEQDPETFYNTIDSEDNKVNALVNLSQGAGHISYNAFENKWFYTQSGDTIALMERKEGADPVKQFGNFLKNSPKGSAIQEHLKKLLEAKP